jgi:SAM-dependent methyltransferase
LANAFVRPGRADIQPVYPLRALLCRHCGLLQLEAAATPDVIFTDYPYFSSISRTLLAESGRFADAVTRRLGIIPGTKVVEVASNDGYLLQFFQARGMDVLGVEPARNVAALAVERGIPTLSRFFGRQTACEVARTFGRPRLLVANNVLAHVPDPNDFIAGLKVLLAPGGTLTVEFHHLLKLVELGQFDNIYHEHFQYFSWPSRRARWPGMVCALSTSRNCRRRGAR